ncbi:MAG: DMT family transporter [Kiritimatiellae bacterium]|nr:DMT family transporter [Kiritimatiellia bacterium]
MKASQTARGVALMVASGVAFCLMAVLVKRGAHINPFRIVLFRFVIGLAVLATAALFRKIRLTFTNSRLLFWRGTIGGVSVFLFFLAIAKLGMGKGTVISFSYPIFASILSAVFLRERIGPLKAVFIVTAFAGIYLLAFSNESGELQAFATGQYEWLAILGAGCAGAAVVMVKKLHDTDSTYAIFLAQCALGLWLVVVPANVAVDAIGYSGGVLLLAIGLVAAIGQLFMTEGYRHLSVTTGSLLGMLVPVLNFAVGALVFEEPVSLRRIIGAAVIVASCVGVIVRGAPRHPA